MTQSHQKYTTESSNIEGSANLDPILFLRLSRPLQPFKIGHVTEFARFIDYNQGIRAFKSTHLHKRKGLLSFPEKGFPLSNCPDLLAWSFQPRACKWVVNVSSDPLCHDQSIMGRITWRENCDAPSTMHVARAGIMSINLVGPTMDLKLNSK